MTLTRLLIPSVIILLTGWRAPAYCQQWIEIETTNCPSAWHDAPSQCPDPFGFQYWGRQYQTWPWSPPNAGPWTINSSMGPIEPGPDFGVRLCSWWMPAYAPNDWHGGCESGWWDQVQIGNRLNWVSPTDFLRIEDPSYLAADPAGHGAQPMMFYPMVPDSESGDQHWPIPADAMNSPPPPGVWRYEADTSSITASGSVGGFLLGSLWDAEVCEVTRDGLSVRIYIGPRFARADFNRDGAVEADDLFSFLAGYFAGSVACDWDGSGWCEVADVTLYLSDWMAQ